MSAGYRADIDGLRAVAVAGVLAFHAAPGSLPGGFTGVDVFFVVSGYLISGIVWRDLEGGRFRYRDFYARRVRRILPALVVMLASVLVAGWVTLLATEYVVLGKHVLGGVTMTSNFVLWKESGYFDVSTDRKPLLHLWSLAIEEQFYLVWPLVLRGARRVRLPLEAVAGAALALSFAANVLVVTRAPEAAFYAPWTRLWELALGALLVRATALAALSASVRQLLGAAGLLAIVGAMLVLDDLTPFPGWAALLPTLGTCFVILAGPDALANRVLGTRPFVFVGLVSYPLYLWHWPLLSFLRLLHVDTPPPGERVVALALAFGLAVVTYALVERPLRSRPGIAVVGGLLAAMLVVAGAAIVVRRLRGVPERIPEPLRQYVSTPYAMNADVNEACWPTGDAPTFPESCLDPGKPGPMMLLWGDSHAGRLAPGLRRVLGDDARMAQFTRSSCPPILGEGNSLCRASNAFVLERVRASRPDTVVLFANWLTLHDPWPALDATLQAIARAGAKRTVILGVLPQWRVDLPRALAMATFRDVPRHRVPTRMTFGLTPGVAELDARMATFAAERGVGYVSAWKLLCDDDGCLTRVDDTPDGLTTWDYGHLTTKGAAYVSRGLSNLPPP